MPKAASAAGAGTSASGDYSNASEISAPVVEEDIHTPIGDASKLGSHRDEEVVEEESEDEEEVAVPVRLKGKGLPQVYQEFSGLEREFSRQGNELGEARSLLRQALEAGLSSNRAKDSEEEPDPTDDEFVANPTASLKKFLTKELKPLQDAVLSAEQRAAMVEFEAKRPGYQEEVADPQFQEWVKAKPSRIRLFKRAASFDMEAADDLFEIWDATKPAADADEPVDKKKAIRRITTETGAAGKNVTGKSGKKIYKSTELMRLRIQDRERYNEMGPEIRAAFAEGRVR